MTGKPLSAYLRTAWVRDFNGKEIHRVMATKPQFTGIRSKRFLGLRLQIHRCRTLGTWWYHDGGKAKAIVGYWPDTLTGARAMAASATRIKRKPEPKPSLVSQMLMRSWI